MQIGSLVVCIIELKVENVVYDDFKPHIKWFPSKDNYYVIKGETMLESGDKGYILEEGVVGFNPHNGREIHLNHRIFKELQHPMKIEIEKLLLTKSDTLKTINL